MCWPTRIGLALAVRPGFTAPIKWTTTEPHPSSGAGQAAYLAEFLRTLTGPIVLVGHSYAGNVISTLR